MIAMESTLTENDSGWILTYPEFKKIKMIGKNRIHISEKLIIMVVFLPTSQKWIVTESLHIINHQTI